MGPQTFQQGFPKSSTQSNGLVHFEDVSQENSIAGKPGYQLTDFKFKRLVIQKQGYQVYEGSVSIEVGKKSQSIYLCKISKQSSIFDYVFILKRLSFLRSIAEYREISCYFSHFENQDHFFIALQNLSDSSLYNYVSNIYPKGVPLAKINALGKSLLSVMLKLAQYGIHCTSISVEDIFLSPDFKVRIDIFGLLRFHCAPILPIPELSAYEGPSPNTDSWNFGCILLCSYLGANSLLLSNLEVETKKLRSLSDSKLSPFQVFLKCLLHLNPRKRLPLSRAATTSFFLDPTMGKAKQNTIKASTKEIPSFNVYDSVKDNQQLSSSVKEHAVEDLEKISLKEALQPSEDFSSKFATAKLHRFKARSRVPFAKVSAEADLEKLTQHDDLNELNETKILTNTPSQTVEMPTMVKDKLSDFAKKYHFDLHGCRPYEKETNTMSIEVTESVLRLFLKKSGLLYEISSNGEYIKVISPEDEKDYFIDDLPIQHLPAYRFSSKIVGKLKKDRCVLAVKSDAIDCNLYNNGNLQLTKGHYTILYAPKRRRIYVIDNNNNKVYTHVSARNPQFKLDVETWYLKCKSLLSEDVIFPQCKFYPQYGWFVKTGNSYDFLFIDGTRLNMSKNEITFIEEGKTRQKWERKNVPLWLASRVSVLDEALMEDG
ncbi:hypothetical protein SJAG_03129 [Schizosaccharomyces japonicus yFS275]|uniref:Protein kinase domain-containing protein n=1 Tax=Schizosaccharomyces japonicus (strain yFS275 / FY16936) TaxID=402676 RepID=B6K3E5_SCHJY|nr:hypothetical protein SJAG_03129 [Schizosaccharomyces japonicus yFS275]EEB08002.1 hypothetical protein SJAG_03129 [Schizosaccharomyces japonicus yFS275]